MPPGGQEAITVDEIGDILVSGRTEVKLNLKLKLPAEDGKAPVDVPLRIPLVFDLVGDEGEEKKLKVETPSTGNDHVRLRTVGAANGRGATALPLETNFLDDPVDFRSREIDRDLCPVQFDEEMTVKLRLPIRIADSNGVSLGKRKFVSIPFKINAKSALKKYRADQGRDADSLVSMPPPIPPPGRRHSPLPDRRHSPLPAAHRGSPLPPVDRNAAARRKAKDGYLCCGLMT